jgi:hypothetical protein
MAMVNQEIAKGEGTTTPSPDRVGELTREGFERLCEEFPDQKPLGCTLFLGQYYARADPGILMLGINPGGRAYRELDLKLHKQNWLLEGPDDLKVRYWTNARRLFGATHELRAAMELATYSFCSPYRTIKWKGLERDRVRSLIRNSKPVMRRMLADCKPKVIIVAGAAGFQVLGYTAGADLELGESFDRGGDESGTYRWKAFNAAHAGNQVVVVQIPHLSRASSKVRLKECGEWLSSIVVPATAS